ncbi:hypothetical protein ACJMK2_038751 [Sinanodonta woodiana]|uniref:Uncharacterized protein n=1 Tax=Sinanodonta woodiana TaxID=1069815 RepID=A0ABD3W9X2_SINWO
MRKVGGPMEVVINNEMMTHASSARHKYHAYLDKKKAEKKDEKTNPKGKKRELALEEVELKSKKLHLEADIASLHASSVQKAEEAELKGLIVLVTESNAFRKRAEEKMTVVASLFKMTSKTKKQIK